MEALLTEQRSTHVLYDREWVSHPLPLGEVMLDQARDICFYDVLKSCESRRGEYTFIYVVSGIGQLSSDNEQIMIREGEYLFAAPHTRWKLVNRSDDVPMRLFVLQMHRRMTSFIENGLWGLMGTHMQTLLCGKDKGYVYDLLRDLMKELANRDRYAPVMLESLLRQLMISVCREAESELGSESREPLEAYQIVPPVTSKQEVVFRIIRYLDDNRVKKKEFQQLAEMVGYSYSHLSHLFREEMGESLQAYWRRRRTQHAKRLLEAGELNVTSIAEALHYQSVHAFSKAFKKAVGITPSDYQQRHGKRTESML